MVSDPHRRNRRVVFVSPHYSPESGAAARRVSSAAKAFRGAGWAVGVVTLLPHHPGNRIHDGYEEGMTRTHDVDGTDVLRLRPWIVPKDGLVLRLLSELVFVVRACFFAAVQRPDVIVASSPYMFLGPLGLLAARLAGAKFVWDVRDLTWLYPRTVGTRTYGFDAVLDRLMRFTASRCDGLVTATEGLMSYFLKRPRRTLVHMNGVSEDWLETLAALPAPSRTNALVVYAGLLGFNHGLRTLIDAAALLPTVAFRLVGDGPERPTLEAVVRSKRLSNVAFVGFVSGDELVDEYRRASVLVSHVRDHPLHRWTQPAKLWEYMATGRPVVHAGRGEVLAVLDGFAVARVVEPDDPNALAKRIEESLEDWNASIEMGHRARDYVQTHRARETLLRELVSMIDELERD